MKQRLIFVLLLVISLSAIAGNPGKRTCVKLSTTMGDIIVELYNETPKHRDNFISLVKMGMYDSLLFHRTIHDFMIQTGDPQSKHAKPGELLGESDLDYTIESEFRVPQFFHKRGALAAAREPDEDNPERRSSASQFYIVWGKTCTRGMLNKAQDILDKNTNGEVRITKEMEDVYQTQGGVPRLDGQYTVFGEVVQGLDVVERIQAVKTDNNDRPLVDVRIIKAVVEK